MSLIPRDVNAIQQTKSARPRLNASVSDQEMINLQIVVADQQVLLYAYWRLLHDLVFSKGGISHSPADDELERVRQIVSKEQAQIKKILACECGHVAADHDEKGCTYIGCRNVCLKGTDG